MAMEVIPAVDLSGGRVVRLLQGDYGRVTGFDETPDEAADRFALAGAGWLHVIDLDAARDGERSPEHAAVLARLARRRGTRAAGRRRLPLGRAGRGGARRRRPARAHRHARRARARRRRGARGRSTARASACAPTRSTARCASPAGARTRASRPSAFVQRFAARGVGVVPGHGDRARRHALGPRPAAARERPRGHRRRRSWQPAASRRSSTSRRPEMRAATARSSAAPSTTARSTCARR